jgi:hypothetical protein
MENRLDHILFPWLPFLVAGLTVLFFLIAYYSMSGPEIRETMDSLSFKPLLLTLKPIFWNENTLQVNSDRILWDGIRSGLLLATLTGTFSLKSFHPKL